MYEEWLREISGERFVKFTYVELPDGEVFMTAQIAGHEVVYSVLRQQTEPFSREAKLTALGSKEAEMKIIGCDLHAAQQTIAMRRRSGSTSRRVAGVTRIRTDPRERRGLCQRTRRRQRQGNRDRSTDDAGTRPVL
jgi:hypothetical protein